MNESLDRESLLQEYAGAELGDARRAARLRRLAEVAMEQPGESFPKLTADEAGLEAAYRFLNNAAVNPDDVLAPHRAMTRERASSAERVLVVHDTTTIQLGHADPDEVGYLQTGKPGFYLHLSLVVSADGQRRPLGVAALNTLFRKARSGRGGRKHNRPGGTTTKQADRESLRWEQGVSQSEELLSSCPLRIHVADREADSYQFFAHVRSTGADFVVRVRHDRVAREIDDDGQSESWSKMREIVGGSSSRFERDVPLSSRQRSTAPTQSRRRPARAERTATLHFATASMELKRPRYFGDPLPSSIRVNVVRVYEPCAPKDQEPIEWLIATSLPVESQSEVEHVVDVYRARWVIEEYFKALKSGCIYEQRQFESRHALLNTLALFLPIACHMLWMRSRAQHADARALDVLTPVQLDVLRAIARTKIPDEPSARDVLWAIAAMGGHLKRNGEPGWASIRHGYERLLIAEVAWTAARQAEM